MKKLSIILAILVVCSFLAIGCSTTPTTTAPAATAPAKTSAAPAGTTAAAPAKTSAAPTSAVPVKTSPSADTPRYGGWAKWVRNMGIPTMGAPSDDPSSTFVVTLATPVLELIVGQTADGRFAPSLAESADISPDGKTITLKLYKGIKFQDGTPFNAEAVKYNLEKVLAANCASSAILKLVTSYEVVDDTTLKINLQTFDARFLLTLAGTGIGQIASPTALAKPTTPANAGKDHIVGTGPFMFDSWQTDQFVKFKKWDGYRVQGRPYLDGIELRNNSDITVSLMSFKAGEVNMVENIDPAQYVSLKKEGYHVDIPPLAFVFSVIPDSANPDSPFKDVRVRQAVEYAIDKEAMCSGIGQGTQFPAYQWSKQPPLGEDGWYIPDLPQRKYDPAKARELLKEAGYPNGFTYPIVSDVRIRQDQVVAIQTYLKAVGINTTLDMADVARASTFGVQGWKGLLVPGFPHFSSFTQWLAAWNDPVFTNPSMYKPAGWKENWDAVTSEIDFDKRMTKMKALLKQAYEEALMVPYLEDGPRYVTDGKLMDMQWDVPGVSGGYDAANMWLKK